MRISPYIYTNRTCNRVTNTEYYKPRPLATCVRVGKKAHMCSSIDLRADLGRAHVVGIEVRDLDVRLAVVEHVEARLVSDGLRRVHTGQDAHLAVASEALHHGVVDLHAHKSNIN